VGWKQINWTNGTNGKKVHLVLWQKTISKANLCQSVCWLKVFVGWWGANKVMGLMGLMGIKFTSCYAKKHLKCTFLSLYLLDETVCWLVLCKQSNWTNGINGNKFHLQINVAGIATLVRQQNLYQNSENNWISVRNCKADVKSRMRGLARLTCTH
jgi:hypothetical protein